LVLRNDIASSQSEFPGSALDGFHAALGSAIQVNDYRQHRGYLPDEIPSGSILVGPPIVTRGFLLVLQRAEDQPTNSTNQI